MDLETLAEAFRETQRRAADLRAQIAARAPIDGGRRVADLLYVLGTPPSEIAKLLGIPRATVSHWIFYARRPRPRQKPKRSKPNPTRDRARELYLEGMPRSEIAQVLGVSQETLGRWVRDLPRRNVVRDDDVRKRVLELYPHKSRAEISQETGVSLPTITRWAREAKLRPRVGGRRRKT